MTTRARIRPASTCCRVACASLLMPNFQVHRYVAFLLCSDLLADSNEILFRLLVFAAILLVGIFCHCRIRYNNNNKNICSICMAKENKRMSKLINRYSICCCRVHLRASDTTCIKLAQSPFPSRPHSWHWLQTVITLPWLPYTSFNPSCRFLLPPSLHPFLPCLVALLPATTSVT